MYYCRTSLIQTRGYGRDSFVSSGIRIRGQIPVRIIRVIINEVMAGIMIFKK